MPPSQTVQSVNAALRRHDPTAILGLLTADVVWQGPPSVPWGGTHHGAEGVKGFLAALGQNFEMTALTCDRLVEQGDTVVSMGRFAGRSTTTGSPAATEFTWVWQVRDGRICRYQGHFDTATVAAALTA